MSQVVIDRWLICRICLRNENKQLYNIFEPIAEEEITDLGPTLLEKIELCGDVRLNQQINLPNKMCNRCLLLLRAAYKFRNLCQQSQNQLKQFITMQPKKETYEINLECYAEVQKTELHEMGTEALSEADYVVEESVVEYDDSPYEPDQNSVAKNDFESVIEDENIEIQSFSESNNSQYIVEEVNDEEFASESKEDEITNYKYEEDSNCDSIIIEEQPKRPGTQVFIKRTNEKKQTVRRKRKNSKINAIYNCKYCDNAYTDKTKYKNHIKIHVKNKPHECEICKKCFSTTPQLSRHMNSHTGNRPYKCQYCEASFGDPSTKIKHERIHTNERPYKCSMCNKAFAYSNVLKVHMMTHTGEKPHTCDYCGKSFSQQHHKNAHEKRHTNINMVLLQNSPDVKFMEEDDLKECKFEETF